MNIEKIISDLGTSRENLFQVYTQYKHNRDSGLDEYHSTCKAFEIGHMNKDEIFFLLLGLSRVEQEIQILHGLKNEVN